MEMKEVIKDLKAVAENIDFHNQQLKKRIEVIENKCLQCKDE